MIFCESSEGGQQGEVETSVPGTVRLQSDHLVSLDFCIFIL